jgi:membrane protein DedA with SNARE-associated domain
MSWSDVVDAIGSPAAGLSVLVESAGVPFPGEALLFGAATWAAARHQPIVVVILFGFLGSTAGADIGYFLGFKGGRPFVERFGSVFHIRPEHLARSELFFARYGDKSLLGAHFLLGLRTWASMLAGMARMPFWRFQLLSAAGSLLWAAVIGLAGYLLGSNLALLETIIKGAGLVGLVVVVALPIILVVALRRVSRPR